MVKYSRENSVALSKQLCFIERDFEGVISLTASIILYTVNSAGRRIHVFPWMTVSLYPHSSTAITGIPHAILSIATIPKSSFFDTAILATAEDMIFTSFRSLGS